MTHLSSKKEKGLLSERKGENKRFARRRSVRRSAVGEEKKENGRKHVWARTGHGGSRIKKGQLKLQEQMEAEKEKRRRWQKRSLHIHLQTNRLFSTGRRFRQNNALVKSGLAKSVRPGENLTCGKSKTQISGSGKKTTNFKNVR